MASTSAIVGTIMAAIGSHAHLPATAPPPAPRSRAWSRSRPSSLAISSAGAVWGGFLAPPGPRRRHAAVPALSTQLRPRPRPAPGVEGPAVDGLVTLRLRPGALQLDGVAEIDALDGTPRHPVVADRIQHGDAALVGDHLRPQRARVDEAGDSDNRDGRVQRGPVMSLERQVGEAHGGEHNPGPPASYRHRHLEDRAAFGPGPPRCPPRAADA